MPIPDRGIAIRDRRILHDVLEVDGLEIGGKFDKDTWLCPIDCRWRPSPNKKAPRTFQPKTPRQPSPRTAKPLLDSRFRAFFCKRHFGNPRSCCIRTASETDAGRAEIRRDTIAVSARFGRCQRWPRARQSRLRPLHAVGRRSEWRLCPP